MKRALPWVVVGAAAILLVLAFWRSGPPSPAEVHRRLLAHPEMAPYARAYAKFGPIATENLSALAAAEPAIYGNLTPSPLLYKFEFLDSNGSALVLYDAGADRILRVFNLFEGRLG